MHVPDPCPESLPPFDFALHLSVRSRTVTPCPAPQVLFTVYLLHELKVPGPFKEKTQAKNKSQIPGGQNAVRAPAAGMRSGRGVAGR